MLFIIIGNDKIFPYVLSTSVVRIQFLAIEIARNREGYNDGLKQKHVAS